MAKDVRSHRQGLRLCLVVSRFNAPVTERLERDRVSRKEREKSAKKWEQRAERAALIDTLCARLKQQQEEQQWWQQRQQK